MKALFKYFGKDVIICIMIFIFIILSWGKAFAYEAGTCRSLDPYYGNIEFRVEESADLDYAVDFQKKHNGQLVTDKDGGFYSVIWSPDVAAPESQYNCFKYTED